MQLEKTTITSGHFISNVNDEILYDEKIIFIHEIDIILSNEILLMYTLRKVKMYIRVANNDEGTFSEIRSQLIDRIV